MNRELFGVFGNRDDLDGLRPNATFDRVVEGPTTTVGVRDSSLGVPGRTAIHEDDAGTVVVWGEAFSPDDAGSSTSSTADWLYDAVRERGLVPLDELNGSYVVVIDVDDHAVVAADTIRSWECFVTDAGGPRRFGTDAAAVARTIPDPSVALRPLYEFLVLGGALNAVTPIAELRRLPLDHALTPTGTVDLGRYHHDPRSFDYVGELAERLQRAVDRRRALPGPTGLLLSGGYDSRAILHLGGRVDRAYTIGAPGAEDVAVARAIAGGFGVEHVHLEADRRYLERDANTIQYTNGIKESLHIHHGGYADDIDVASIYHGLLWDTVLRGYFLPRAGIDVMGLTVPRPGLDPSVDPVAHLTGILGYLPGADPLIEAGPLDVDTGSAFVEATVGPAFDECAATEDSVYAALERFGVQNVLSSPFRAHLADTYVESLIAADRELIDWHLHTPPAARSDRTFRRALARIDDDVFEPRPPDRPHDSFLVNQIEKRLRLSLPGLEPFDTPLPDRRAVYEANGFDERLLPDRPDLHGLPPRVKLRINDLRVWLDGATRGTVSLDRYLPELGG